MSERNRQTTNAQKQEDDHKSYKAAEKELQTGDKKLDGPNRPST